MAGHWYQPWVLGPLRLWRTTKAGQSEDDHSTLYRSMSVDDTFSFVRRDPETLYTSGWTATPLASASVLLVGHILIQPYNRAHRQQDLTLCLFCGTTYWSIQRHHTSLGVSAQLGLSEDSTNDRVSRRAVLLLTCKPFRSVSSTPLTYFPL